MKFWIFGVAFLLPSIIDIAISWIDTFELVTDIQPSCNLSSDKIHHQAAPIVDGNSTLDKDLKEVVDLISAATFSWSILMTGVFSVVFFVGCFSHIQSKTKLKVLLEVSILVSLFGPVTNVSLLLRNCATGYALIGTSLVSYSTAIVIVAVALEFGFTSFRWSYIGRIIVFIFLTACKAVQIVACTSTFGLFFGTFVSHPIISYTYLFFIVVEVCAMWTANMINRWKFYHLFFDKTSLTPKCSAWPRLPCVLLSIRLTDILVSLLNTLSCMVLVALTVLYFDSSGALFIIAIVSLSLSCLVSLYQLPWKHCCVNEPTDDEVPFIGYE